MSYEESIEYLYKLQTFGARLGLEHTRELANAWGNPQEELKFIHVAGTNGKGSTCACLESIFREAGLKVGLYTSPHLVRFSERIQVNHELISESEVARLVGEFKEIETRFGQETTFFEAVTVIALKYFAEQKCDLVIWETGLGGRLDATNIVTPIVSVITGIDFDHEKWLGNSLAEIAGEKAGIIKPGVPVVVRSTHPEALDVIRNTAKINSSPFHLISPTRPTYLEQNAEVAEAVARLLNVDENLIREGVRNVSWPGRFQFIKHGAQTVLLDGAHNPAGARALVTAYRQKFGNTAVPVILGMFADKNVKDFCGIIQEIASEVILTSAQSERALPPSQILPYFKIPAQVSQNLSNALLSASCHPFIVITGSLYLIGEALELLGKEACSLDEKALNDWTGGANFSKIK